MPQPTITPAPVDPYYVDPSYGISLVAQVTCQHGLLFQDIAELPPNLPGDTQLLLYVPDGRWYLCQERERVGAWWLADATLWTHLGTL